MDIIKPEPEKEKKEKTVKINKQIEIITDKPKPKSTGKIKDKTNKINNNTINPNTNRSNKSKKGEETYKNFVNNINQNININTEKTKHNTTKNNFLTESLKNSIYLSTKKKLGKIFFTKKRKNKNNDYLETENTTLEATLEKEKNVNEFLQRAKTIKYEGYNYSINNQDYFQRNNQTIMTILNSEDAAIKKCEELFSQIPEGDKWIDTDFGSQKNNPKMNKESLYGKDPIPIGGLRDTNIEWYPLSDISDCAQFFSDGVESNDVIQGCLGDCWFISALSVLATKDFLLRGEFNEELLEDKIIDSEEKTMLSTGVYPPIFHSFRKKGIFCFRFFKNFKWRYVLVDNRLPCGKIYNDNQTPVLLYGKCRSTNEFWVSLIEKAYAKLHGSYSALASGFIDDGLVDLTGLTSKKMVIDSEKMRNRNEADKLWEILLSNSSLEYKKNKLEKQMTEEGKVVSAKFYTRNKTMMGCSVESKGNNMEQEVVFNNRHTGILAGHAYSILDVFEIPKPRGKKRGVSRLLRIRNPWGRKEWNGKWSDDSVEAKKNKERIEEKLNEKYKGTHEKINLSQEDGTFLMCFSDFRNIFNKLFICKSFPSNYIGLRIFGQWTSKETGGLPVNAKQEKTFYNNPQYYMERKVDGMVTISLLQNDGRLNGEKFPFPKTINKVCLLIFKTQQKKRVTNLNNLLEKTLIVNRRDSILELNLNKGAYIIIPSTFDYGKTGDYCLEFHFEDKLFPGNEIEGINKINCIKNTVIEKLGGENARWEILSEFIASKTNKEKTNKEQFIIQKFKDIIKDEDDYEYGNNRNKKKKGTIFNKGNLNNDDDDEDFDYI